MPLFVASYGSTCPKDLLYSCKAAEIDLVIDVRTTNKRSNRWSRDRLRIMFVDAGIRYLCDTILTKIPKDKSYTQVSYNIAVTKVPIKATNYTLIDKLVGNICLIAEERITDTRCFRYFAAHNVSALLHQCPIDALPMLSDGQLALFPRL